MDKAQWQEAAKHYWTSRDDSAYSQSIQTAMENDPEFKNYILEHENVFAVLEYAIAEDLKQKMDSWKGQNGKVIQISNPARRWRTFVARAAAVALLIVAGLYVWPVDPHKQALKNYKPLMNDVERGGEKSEVIYNYPLIFEEGQKLMEEKRYEEALDKMRSVIEANPNKYIVEDAEWNMLVLLKVIDPKGEDYKALYMKIKHDASHHYNDRLRHLRKWGI